MGNLVLRILPVTTPSITKSMTLLRVIGRGIANIRPNLLRHPHFVAGEWYGR